MKPLFVVKRESMELVLDPKANYKEPIINMKDKTSKPDDLP